MSATVPTPGAYGLPQADAEYTQSVNATLQEKVSSLRANLNDPNLTKDTMLMITTDLQSVYKKLLLLDLDRGVQKQLENFLWNDCFKKPLNAMSRVDLNLFHMMIESGIGFYLGFIQELQDFFGAKLGYGNQAQVLYCTMPRSQLVTKQEPSKEVIYYMIQNSIVHVGDLLRYRSSFQDAQRMYDKATRVNPSNGHPWNQMGLVQLLISYSIESMLVGVYCYVRALGVSNPFLPAQQNLEGLLQKVPELTPESPSDEIIISFLRQILSILSGSPSPTRFCLTQPSKTSSNETCNMPIETLNRDHLFLMVVISLWAWKRETDKGRLGEENLNETKALELIAALINGLLTVKNVHIESGIDEKFQLIAYINIMLKWIQIHPGVGASLSFKSQLNLTSLCAVANQITALPTSYLATDDELKSVILPEERKLLEFLPIGRAYEHLRVIIDNSNPRCNAIRSTRFLNLLEYFTSQCPMVQLIGNEFKAIVFKPPSTMTRPTASRQNVALQSLLRQFPQSSSSPSASAAVLTKNVQGDMKTKSHSHSPVTFGLGLGEGKWNPPLKDANSSSQPTVQAWPTPPQSQSRVSASEAFGRWGSESNSPVSRLEYAGNAGQPPPGFQQRPLSSQSGLVTYARHDHHQQSHTGSTAVASADTSPIPSATPTPIETSNFSLLFNSIWTPMGSETNKDPRMNNDPWKF